MNILKLQRFRLLLKQRIFSGIKILDFGAGNKSLKKTLIKMNENIIYKSLDIDDYYKHDYSSYENLPLDTFDIVIMSEVIEHMKLMEVLRAFESVCETLKTGGRLIITTPNVMHPTRFRSDVTHITPICYDQLGGFLKMAGLKKQNFFRVYNDPLHRKILKKYIFSFVFKFLEIDFAPTLIVEACKTSE